MQTEILSKSLYTTDKEQTDLRKEYLSKSGNYKLVVKSFKTGNNTWNYTTGEVYKKIKDNFELLHTVKRNYSSFPYLFIENHKDGHHYLVCGADYQGQTVIDLTTEARSDFLPLEAKKGTGFCWTEYKFDQESSILIVCGCIWACPYEFRFFDFSDPIHKNWPELVPENNDYVEADDMWPTITRDGTIKYYQTEHIWDDEDVEVDNKKIMATRTFKRDGNTLKLVKEWQCEEEKERRQKAEDHQKEWEKWYETFKTTDPLYLEHMEQLKDPVFTADDWHGVGRTYNGWAPGFDKEETRISRRIIKSSTTKDKWIVDLEWGAKEGPIKIQVFKNQRHHYDKFFDHTIGGMRSAFEYAKSFIVPAKKNWLNRAWNWLKGLFR